MTSNDEGMGAIVSHDIAIGSTCVACAGNHQTAVLSGLVHTYDAGHELEEWRYRLVECQDCGLGYVEPSPTWDILQTFYPSSYGCYASSAIASEERSVKYTLARWRFTDDKSCPWRSRARRGAAMLSEMASGKTISHVLGGPLQYPLDAAMLYIGSGYGLWLLSMANLGYRNLHGYDIDANPMEAQNLRGRGISLSSGVFLENDYPEGYFDCIRMEQVFEHLIDPGAMLDKCFKMLKPGGRLLLLFPCKDAWSYKLSVPNWSELDLPRHLFLHTERSSRLLLTRAGYDVEDIRSYASSANFLATAMNMSGWSGSRKPLKAHILASPLYSLFSKATGKGEFLSVSARRPERETGGRCEQYIGNRAVNEK